MRLLLCTLVSVTLTLVNGQDADPKTTQMFLAQKVAPVFHNAVDLYTEIVVDIHKQLGEQKEEFADLDDKTQEKLKKTMTKLSEAAQKLCFFANKMKIMARNDEKSADKSRENDIQKVRDLAMKKIDMKSKAKDLKDKLKAAVAEKAKQMIALEVKKQALKVAEKALKASPCKKGGKGRRKRSVNQMFCAATKPLQESVKQKKAAVDKQKELIKETTKNVTALENENKKMNKNVNDVRKDEANKEAKKRKQAISTEEASQEVCKGKKLIKNMIDLEALFKKVDKGIASNLKMVDENLAFILDACKQINVILTSFKLPGGRKIPPAKLKTLEKFGDEADKLVAMKQIKERRRKYVLQNQNTVQNPLIANSARKFRRTPADVAIAQNSARIY